MFPQKAPVEKGVKAVQARRNIIKLSWRCSSEETFILHEPSGSRGKERTPVGGKEKSIGRERFCVT